MPNDISTRNRILHILQLYERRDSWSVDEIAHEMGTSVSSSYRDVQELMRLEFLTAVVGARYVLGPAFSHFDLLMRQNDPLLRVAIEHMKLLIAATTSSSVSILTRSYQDKVMCIHQEIGHTSERVGRYERGATMPLFRGATSKVVLAHQNRRTLEKIYLDHEEEMRAAAHGITWKNLREELDAIRKAGVAVSDSDITEGTTGIAAPLFIDKQVVAGLSLVVRTEHCELDAFKAAVIETAHKVSERLSDIGGSWIARG